MSTSSNPWRDYLSTEPIYEELSALKQQGWANSTGDTFFEKRRETAANPSRMVRQRFYNMTKTIGNDLARATGIFNLNVPRPRILDLCMAPGGFSSTTREHLRRCVIDAVTLPPENGGHEVMAKGIFQNIEYADITMYAQEMAVEEEGTTPSSSTGIPAGHPDSLRFKITRPFLENKYDLVFCGGAVVRHHPREPYRDTCEASRLTISQLVFAMNRVKPRGSLVLLLHRVEAWDTVCMLHTFSKFSDIQLFKHPRFHAIKSSFYLVATNIDLDHDSAKDSLVYWQSLWRYLTFRNSIDIGRPSLNLFATTNELALELRHSFGPRFMELARPIWRVQSNALRAADFTSST